MMKRSKPAQAAPPAQNDDALALVPGDVIARGVHAKVQTRYRVLRVRANGDVKLEGPLGESWSLAFWTHRESIVVGGYRKVRAGRRRGRPRAS